MQDRHLAELFDKELKNVMEGISQTCSPDSNSTVSHDTFKKLKCVEGLHQLFRLCQRSILHVIPQPTITDKELILILRNIFTGTSLLIDKISDILTAQSDYFS